VRVGVCLLLALVVGSPAFAQSSWTYSLRLAGESTSTRANADTPMRRASSDPWASRQVLVTSGDATWNHGDRFRAGAALTGVATQPGGLRGRVRELYARLSTTSWLDLEAGKRIVRWGVGYGFSPAGVLDPPRVADDPADRLGLNEGRLLARADLFHRQSSLTVAAAERMTAARVSTVVPGGFELAAVAAANHGSRPRYGATLTHVIGQRLEWHAEALVHDDGDARVLSAAGGLQFTLTAGLNVVVEYHRNASGLDDSEWNDVLSGRRTPGSRPTRRNLLFLRAAGAGGDEALAPELIVIASPEDGGWTVVPSLAWRAHQHFHAYVRATHLAGPPRSIAGSAPYDTSLTVGVRVRF